MLVGVLAMLAPLARSHVNMEQGGAHLGPATNPDLSPSQWGARVLWTPPQRARVANLFWSHIPKTSTSFGRTFFSYACGDDADDFRRVTTIHPASPRVPGLCTGSINEEQDAIVNATIDRVANAIAHDRAHISNIKNFYLSWHHMGLPWTASAHILSGVDADAQEKRDSPTPPVAGVTMFRKPSERLLSEYRMLSWAGHRCCSDINQNPIENSWGWDRQVRLAAVAAVKGMVFPPDMNGPRPQCPTRDTTVPLDDLTCRAYNAPFDPALNTSAARLWQFTNVTERSHSLFGCQTKMLLGYGCHEAHMLTEYEMARARAYVQHSAPERLFIGMTHRYNESVCLFHAVMGGSLWDYEVLQTPQPSSTLAADPTAARPEGAASDALFDSADTLIGYSSDGLLTAADFARGAEDPDTEIFALAETRFEAALKEHRAEVNECMSHVQPTRM